jgi:hypothetical protein
MKGVRNRIAGGIILIIFALVMFALYREFRLFYGFGFMGLFSLIIFGAVAITFITSIVQGIKGNQQHNPPQDGRYHPDHHNPSYDDAQTYNQPKKYNVYRGYYDKCPMCDSETEPDQKFCINCGNKLKD